MEGWIKIYRKITDDPMYFSEKFTRTQAWIDLLLLANFDESYIYIRGRKVIIRRGQIAKSKEWLSERWGWSKGKVLSFLSELQKSGKIELQNSKLIGLISIVNYNKYQEIELQNEPQTEPQKRLQIKPQTEPPNKNVKKVKNNIVSKDTYSPSKEEESSMKLPAEEIKNLWNTTCKSFPRLISISEARRNKMRIRITEMGGPGKAMKILKTIFSKMEDSLFLKGQNKRGWKASFDWIFENGRNWVKVWEGNYDNQPEPVNNRNNGTNQQHSQYNTGRSAEKQQRDQEFEAYIAAKLSGDGLP